MDDFHSRFKVRIRELQRRSVRFLGGLSNRDAEYDFAYRQVVGDRVEVLDVGASESLLPLTFANRGYSVTVYDFREYPEYHPNILTVKGDFITNQIPDGSFDYVVMVSTIEHIGFGSYGAPKYSDGDFLALSQAKRVLKPTGRIILTFPFASSEHIVDGFERWYEINRVKRLFEGMYILAEEYYVPYRTLFGKIVKWVPASLEEISNTEDVVKRYGSQCNACYSISPLPRTHFPNQPAD